MPLTFTALNDDMTVADDFFLPGCGGDVVFSGIVRSTNHGKAVNYLEYEAHQALAEKMFLKLEDDVKNRFHIATIDARHRLGRVNPGEKAVIIKVLSAHRHEAFLACRFLMDELKAILPIWRKEVYGDQTFSFATGAGCGHQDNEMSFLQPTKRALKARDIDIDRLVKKRVLLIGAGGLGCPVALNLAALGIGHLTVYDGDMVEQANLARQFLYKLSEVGVKKALLLKRFIEERNSFIKIENANDYIDEHQALKIASGFDLIIDATDSMFVKRMLKLVCFTTQTALVSGSVYQSEGEVGLWMPSRDGACLNCFTASLSLGTSCSAVGVLPHACSLVAALMAEQALAVLSAKVSLPCSVTLCDAVSSRIKTIAINKDKYCHVCGIPAPSVTHPPKLVRLMR